MLKEHCLESMDVYKESFITTGYVLEATEMLSSEKELCWYMNFHVSQRNKAKHLSLHSIV